MPNLIEIRTGDKDGSLDSGLDEIARVAAPHREIEASRRSSLCDPQSPLHALPGRDLGLA